MPEKLFNRNFTTLICISFCSGLTAQLINTALPLYMVNLLGGTATASGLLSALYTIISCCCRPVSGVLVDRYGRRNFILAGLAVYIVGSFGFGFVRTVPLLVLFRGLQGLGFGFAATASSSFASDNIPQAELGRGLGFLGMCNALPMVVGPSLALLLIGTGAYSSPFVSAALMLFIALLLTLITKEDKSVFRNAERRKLTWDSIIEPHALPPSLAVLFLAMAAACVMVYGTLFAQSRGYTNASAFYMLSAVAMLLIRIPFQRAVDRHNGYLFVIPSCLAWFVGFMIMLLVKNQTAFLLSGILYGGGLGLAQTVLSAIGLRGVTAERRGAANATFLLCFDAGIGIGAVTLGKLIDATSFEAMIIVGACCLLVAALLSLIFMLRGGGKVQVNNETQT